MISEDTLRYLETRVPEFYQNLQTIGTGLDSRLYEERGKVLGASYSAILGFLNYHAQKVGREYNLDPHTLLEYLVNHPDVALDVIWRNIEDFYAFQTRVTDERLRKILRDNINTERDVIG